MCEKSDAPKNDEVKLTTKVKSLFVIKVDDPLIISLEKNESAQSKIIACRKQIYLHKKKGRRRLKTAFFLLLLSIACIYGLIMTEQAFALKRDIAYAQAQSMHEFLSVTFNEHIVRFDELNKIVSINGININEISNNESDKIYNEGSPLIFYSTLLGFSFLLCFTASLYNFGEIIMADSLKPYEDMIVQCEEELDLQELKTPDVKEQIDDKRFKQHQRELKRYYDLNLKQSKSMFHLGIFVIIAGITIILVTLIVFQGYANENAIPIIVGSISGTLTDFIGFMFIRMYSQNMVASIKYHDKLVSSNNLLLSNVIVSRISEKTIKDETYSMMAQNTVKLTAARINDSTKKDE